MDFLDPAKKRAHRIRLLIGYVLVGIAIGMGTIVLGIVTFGYTYDRKTGTVIQNGLVFISAQPESADITINDAPRGNTNTRLNLPAGQYTIRLNRNGYREWKRTFTLRGGSIERLVYPRLFPTKLTMVDEQLYGEAPTLAAASPDRHWLLVAHPDNNLNFDVFDLNDPQKQPTSLAIPADLLSDTSAPNSLSLVEWSTDNRHVLLLHTYADNKTEYLMVDREVPVQSVNLSRVFGNLTGTVSLRDKKYDQYYIFDAAAKTLATGDLKTHTPKNLLNHVLAYKSYGKDVVLYVSDQDQATTTKAAVMLHDPSGSYELRELPAGNQYLVDITQYSGNWYVAAGAVSDDKVYVYKDPFDIIKTPSVVKALVPVAVLKVDDPRQVDFSSSAQFVETNNGRNFAVYDIENDRNYHFATAAAIDDGTKVRWMDGNRMTLNSQSKTVVFDFDNSNAQTLAATLSGFGPFFDRDYENLYNIAPSVAVPGRFALTRTDLKINN